MSVVRNFDGDQGVAFSDASAESALRCGCPLCAGAGADGEDGGGPQFVLPVRGGGVIGPNGKPSLTGDEAALRLTRTGLVWDSFAGPGEATVVSYAFRASAPATMPKDTSGFSRFNFNQIAAAELALAGWSDAANIVFQRVGSGVTGEAAYSNNATILFSNYATASDGAAAFAYLPGSRSPLAAEGDIWVKPALAYNNNPVLWDYGFQVLTHEIGHAIGLSHPSPYNASAEDDVTYEANATYFEDARMYTSMSYFASANTGANLPGFAAAPQMDDIAAAQRLYGPNLSTRVGDTVYGFNSTAGRPWFSAVEGGPVPVFSVWDAGGEDTFDFSRYVENQAIDLREGAFSSIGGSVFNVSVARGAVIENAVGGAGADLLTGNGVVNRLTGGAGADTANGGGGGDFLFGGDGDDALDGEADGDFVLGGAGNDRMLGGSGADLLGGEDGADWLTGGADGDNLYGGAGSDLLFGEDGLDFLSGQEGDDVLAGNGGWDVMHGGVGADRFLIFGTIDSNRFAADIILDFTSGEDRLDVSPVDADETLAGDQAFRFVGYSDGATGIGTLRLGFVEGVGIYLYGYTNADDVPDLMVNIGTFAIGAGDIVL